jgi:hypothetical protein
MQLIVLTISTTQPKHVLFKSSAQLIDTRIHQKKTAEAVFLQIALGI